MSRLAPGTEAIQDMLLAVLRDAGEPLTTNDISERVSPSHPMRFYPVIYRRLIALRREGRVVSWQHRAYRSVWWALPDRFEAEAGPHDGPDPSSWLTWRQRT